MTRPGDEAWLAGLLRGWLRSGALVVLVRDADRDSPYLCACDLDGAHITTADAALLTRTRDD